MVAQPGPHGCVCSSPQHFCFQWRVWRDAQELLNHHGETKDPDVLRSLLVQGGPQPDRLVAAMTARLPSPGPGRLRGVMPSKVPMGQSHPPRSPDITPYFSPVPRPAALHPCWSPWQHVLHKSGVRLCFWGSLPTTEAICRISERDPIRMASWRVQVPPGGGRGRQIGIGRSECW